MSALSSSTDLSLMSRLRKDPKDRDSWNKLTERYGRMLYSWCRRWGLQDADAEEVTANVFENVAKAMGGTDRNGRFVYDPSRSFRAWLKKIVHNEWQNFVKFRKRAGQGLEDVRAEVEDKTAREAARDLTEAMQAEFERELLELAMLRVKARVEARTWEAFRLTALEGMSGAEAAAALKMPLTSVFKARSRVQKHLKEEVERLKETEDR